MPNSFDVANRVRCFNHTLQLSAKTLLRPFNAGLGKTTEDSNDNDTDDLLDEELDDDNDDGLPDVPDADDIDDGIDEMNELDADQ